MRGAAPPPAMSPTIRVRPAQSADCAAIWAVHTRAIRHGAATHYSPGDLAAWSSRMTPASYAEPLLTRTVLVAERADGRIVGFAQLNAAEGAIDAVYVDPDETRRGAGRALVEALERQARTAGVTSLALDASLNAVPFYEALGYRRECDTRHALGDGHSIACVLMTKRLDVGRADARHAMQARRRTARTLGIVLGAGALLAALEIYAIRTFGRRR
jgi:L-amino acid N-acyltransferase YncA